MKTLKFILPIYRCDITYLVSDRDTYNAWLKKEFEIDGADITHTAECVVLHKEGETRHRFIVWLSRFEWYITDMAALSHEITHLTDRICEYVGINGEEKEPRAYLHEYLYKQALEWLKPKKRMKSKPKPKKKIPKKKIYGAA